MRKNLLPNNGVPLFIDPEKDLIAKTVTTGGLFDSWYMNACVVLDGKPIGLQWHHQVQEAPQGIVTLSEFAVSDGELHKYFPHGLAAPFSETCGAAGDRMAVYSPLCSLSGDRNKMHLTITAEDCSMDVTLEGGDLLCNGTMGLVRFIGADSYQYSFPNMKMNGTLTLNGKEYQLTDQTAWFDRQWSIVSLPGEHIMDIPGCVRLSWLWFGLGLPTGEYISLWDAYGCKGKNAFATILRKDGTNENVLVDVIYENIWTSKHTGCHYPREVIVKVPTEDLELKLVSLIDNPEADTVVVNSCQDLCKVTGTCKGQPINDLVVLEIVGDICGEV